MNVDPLPGHRVHSFDIAVDNHPTEESDDSHTAKDGGEHPEFGHEKTEPEPPPDEIMALLASVLFDAEEASDSASLAVWTSGMSGPLPPPWILKEYDQTINDGANRIMAMAEKSQAAMIADGENQRKAEALALATSMRRWLGVA